MASGSGCRVSGLGVKEIRGLDGFRAAVRGLWISGFEV